MKDETDSGKPLEIEKHEQFARCLAAGNYPLICYYGVGYPRDETAAIILANSAPIRKRAEEIYAELNPKKYRSNGYEHIIERMKRERIKARRNG